jgi:p-aminobenzoyl-glutamate transporter AbgT
MSNASYIDASAASQWSIFTAPFLPSVIFIGTSDTLIPADGILGNNVQNTIEITVYP